jgi:5-methylcytosine-specific restriction endonuclease McrA
MNALPGKPMRVAVIDKSGSPLMPCHPARARKLLSAKKADVACMNPFTIRILDRVGGDLQEMEIKLDPGSKTTGVVVTVKGAIRGWFVVMAFELAHRGQAIRKLLAGRSALRHGRRSRKTRYRKARFLNRTRKAGWLPPSLRSRVDNVTALCGKLIRICPITAIAVEQVRFDLQKHENPEISGAQYQQGTLFGYEVREYLLEKWARECAYCAAQGVPLQIEHIQPKSRGGTDRVSNLCLACEACNQKKASKPIEVFLKGKPELLRKIQAQAKRPLHDAAAVNTTRLFIVEELRKLNLPVTAASGGRTKFNRCTQGYAKSHWTDAACVGETGAKVDLGCVKSVLLIQAKGRGSRQMCLSGRFGFPRTKAKSVKRVHGFQTGDRVCLLQPSGKYAGTHEGEVSVRATGKFDIKAGQLKITAPHSRFTLISRFDGYRYERRAA